MTETSVRPMVYTSLHTHTTYSTGDGFGTVAEHVARVQSLGMNALALSEHGNPSSWVDLEKCCRAIDYAVKPIFGLEGYFAPENQARKCHMGLLAMNQTGLKNLNRIVTESWKTLGTTSKSRFPTIHWPVLKEFNDGIIALSGCADSQLSCILLGGKSYGDRRMELSNRDIDAGVKCVRQYQKIFGDRYYLEVQRFPGLERTCLLNPALAEIGRRTGAQLVATCDVHYPFPDQNAMQRILHAAHRGGSVESADADWEYDILLTYPFSDNEIESDLELTGLALGEAADAVMNTAEIAKRCNVELPKAPRPKYIIDPERDWQTWI